MSQRNVASLYQLANPTTLVLFFENFELGSIFARFFHPFDGSRSIIRSVVLIRYRSIACVAGRGIFDFLPVCAGKKMDLKAHSYEKQVHVEQESTIEPRLRFCGAGAVSFST